MFLFEYRATLVPDEDGGFVVHFPDFPEATAQGDTAQEALDQAADSLDEAVANRIVMGLDVPEARTPVGRSYAVAVPASTALKASLYNAIRRLGMNKVQLAAHLGVDEKEVRRLLDPHHPSKLTRIEELMNRIGQRIVIGVQSFPVEESSHPQATSQRPFRAKRRTSLPPVHTNQRRKHKALKIGLNKIGANKK